MFMTPHPGAELDEVDQEIKGNPEVDAYAFLKMTVQQAIDAKDASRRISRRRTDFADLVGCSAWSDFAANREVS